VDYDDEQEQSESGSDSFKGKNPRHWQLYWNREVRSALKRLRTFHKRGNTVVERYLDERGDTAGGAAGTNLLTDRRLNLFHANITTQESMLYGQPPKVDVSRANQDPDDDAARVAALILKRMLEAEEGISGCDIDTCLSNALQDRLLPGLATARVMYDYGPKDGDEDDGAEVDWETATAVYVHWQDFLWGWCRTWNELSWMAFRSYMCKDEWKKRFPGVSYEGVDFKAQEPDESDGERSAAQDQKSTRPKAEVWEIWDRNTNSVYWFAKGAEKILDHKEDPLKLDGFWPAPRPMMANCTTRLMEPKPDFMMAQDIYNQIDELYTRITIITTAVKVVGVYDASSAKAVANMLEQGVENDLIPVDNWAMMAEKGGLKGVIDWYPVQDVVGVLATLRDVLGQQISLLREVTGMSDIMRGESDQYAGVGQDQLKAKFGSVRLQRIQEDFARFASELEGLRCEIIQKHFDQTSIIAQANVETMPMADFQNIGPALQLIKSDMLSWRVKVKPESMAMADYAQIQAERTEFLNAVATYIQSAQAMAKAEPGSLPVLMEMLKWAMAGFKGADVLEGTLDRAIEMATQAQQQQQANQQPSPEMIKAQTEQMKAQTALKKAAMDLQKVQVKARADLMNLQTKLQGEMQKLMAEQQGDMQAEDQRVNNRIREVITSLEADLKQISEQLNADLQVERAQSTMAIAEQDNSHANALEMLAAETASAAVKE
jgi:hypothetical protein